MSLSATKNILSKSSANRLPPPPIDVLKKALNINYITVDWLAGDGSDRCYYRIKSSELENSLVLMQLSSSDAYLLEDDKYDWMTISKELNDNGILAPKTRVVLKDYAAIIIDDYGDRMLESLISTAAENDEISIIKKSILDSLDLIIKMIALPKKLNSPWTSRAFDEEKYEWEFNFFKEKFLELYKENQYPESFEKKYKEETQKMSKELAKQSNYFTHRDFHSRNIMQLNDGELALIDFQDARLGSPIYDWASICFDSYVPIDFETRLSLFLEGMEKIKEVISDKDIKEVEKNWKLIVVQRSIKALASFAFLEIDKKRGSYLQYEPTILSFFKTDKFDLSEYPLFNKLLKDLSK